MDQPMNVPGMFGGNSSSHHDVKEEDEDEMMDEDVPERTSSTSSRSQSPGGALSREDCEDHHHNSMASKENLRGLMMLSSSSRSPVESPCSFTKHRYFSKAQFLLELFLMTQFFRGKIGLHQHLSNEESRLHNPVCWPFRVIVPSPHP